MTPRIHIKAGEVYAGKRSPLLADHGDIWAHPDGMFFEYITAKGIDPMWIEKPDGHKLSLNSGVHIPATDNLFSVRGNTISVNLQHDYAAAFEPFAPCAVDEIIRQPKLNVRSITEMSALGTREAGRDAATAFLNEHEARGITIDAQNETIKGLQRTIDEQANRIDLLTKQYNDSKAECGRYMRYAVELSTQLRTNVAANVRALAIADEVMADAALANRVADIEKTLSTQTILATFEDVPHAIADSDAEPIPDGVFVIVGYRKFRFCDANGVEMDDAFQDKWSPRRTEFPFYDSLGSMKDLPEPNENTTAATRMLMDMPPTLKQLAETFTGHIND